MKDQEKESQNSRYELKTFDGETYLLPQGTNLESLGEALQQGKYIQVNNEALVLCSTVKSVKKVSNPYW